MGDGLDDLLNDLNSPSALDFKPKENSRPNTVDFDIDKVCPPRTDLLTGSVAVP